MFDRFTDRSRKVMGLARQEAERLRHEYIGTEHILLGLVQEGSGVAANVLKYMDIDLRKVRREVEKLVQTGPAMVTMGQLPFTPRAKKVLERALEVATDLGHNYIGTEHILLGLVREQDGKAAKILSNLSVRLDEVRNEVLDFLGAEPADEDSRWDGDDDVEFADRDEHPLLKAHRRRIAALDREKEAAVEEHDFERAARLRDDAYKLRKQVVSLEAALAQAESTSRSGPTFLRQSLEIEIFTGPTVRAPTTEEVVEGLFRGRSVLLVGEPGSGRAVTIGLVARDLVLRSLRERRQYLELVQPDLQEIIMAEDSDALSGWVGGVVASGRHLPVLPDLHLLLDDVLMSGVEIEGARKALMTLRSVNAAFLSWTTHEGLQALRERWPGLLEDLLVVVQGTLGDDELEALISHRMAEIQDRGGFSFETGFARRVVEQSRGRPESVIEPAGAYALLEAAIDEAVDASGRGGDVENDVGHAKRSLIDSLKERIHEAVSAGRFRDVSRLAVEAATIEAERDAEIERLVRRMEPLMIKLAMIERVLEEKR